jgi:hypothetical protein
MDYVLKLHQKLGCCGKFLHNSDWLFSHIVTRMKVTTASIAV